MSRRRDPHTKDLLAWEAQAVRIGYSSEVAGSGDLGNQIARLIGQALRDSKDAGRDRNDVARAMGEYLGRHITKNQIDKWASEASDEQRIPLDAFIALIAVTQELRLLAFIPGQFGHAVVSDRYADMIELFEIEEHQRDIELRASALKAKVRGAR
ncbi:hypothetical protein [Aureimonas sp. SK2]|uniref:hypothetical protein n=1 Tax=Aureimonas sp. SK2 TaxID=3015992 RepID=UPI002444FFFF|nr:hypothetical protein [Aureimonas sp. SK2]